MPTRDLNKTEQKDCERNQTNAQVQMNQKHVILIINVQINHINPIYITYDVRNHINVQLMICAREEPYPGI